MVFNFVLWSLCRARRSKKMRKIVESQIIFILAIIFINTYALPASFVSVFYMSCTNVLYVFGKLDYKTTTVRALQLCVMYVCGVALCETVHRISIRTAKANSDNSIIFIWEKHTRMGFSTSRNFYILFNVHKVVVLVVQHKDEVLNRKWIWMRHLHSNRQILHT